MKYLKTFGCTVAADVLSLFIGFTLASSSMVFIRIISTVCTCGILICFMVSHGIKTAEVDMRASRINGTEPNLFQPLIHGAAASAPAFISWAILFASRASGSFDFYRWHKLINGYFLQIYNFINSDASAYALSSSQIFMMLPLAFIPAVSFISAYYYSCKKC